MKQFAVIGLGTFGFNLAMELAKQGHQVLAIDANKDIVDNIKDFVSEAVIVDAMDKLSLSELIHHGFEAVILGMGEKYMEATVITIVHLKNMGVKNIIVKSMNELRGHVYLSVGATEIIYPEKETAVRLARKLTIPALIDQISLSPEFGIMELTIPDSFIGKKLRDLRYKEKYNVAIIAIKDVLRDSMILTPEPSHQLLPDSVLIIIGLHKDIEKIKHFK